MAIWSPALIKSDSRAPFCPLASIDTMREHRTYRKLPLSFYPDDHLPAFLRWSDYLTGKSCVLRIKSEDVDARIGKLVSEYLAVRDANNLVSDRRLLPDSLFAFQAFQDITLTLSDDGVSGSLIPGSVLRNGPRELSLSETAPREIVLLNGSYAHLLEVTIDRSETGYSRNWLGFDKRRWERNRNAFQKFVDNAANGEHESRVSPSSDVCSDSIEFLRSLAKAIWDSPFENYSRFTGMMLPYKTGDETLLNIVERSVQKKCRPSSSSLICMASSQATFSRVPTRPEGCQAENLDEY